MEKTAVETNELPAEDVTNVRPIRPEVTPKSAREQELVDHLLRRLQDHKESGIEVDSIVFTLHGTMLEVNEDGTTEKHTGWASVHHWIAEERPTLQTLSYASTVLQAQVIRSVVESFE